MGSRSTHVVDLRQHQPAAAGRRRSVYLGTGQTGGGSLRRQLPVPSATPRRTRSTNYNGLQTSLRRRRANGLEFLASYTFSKALTRQPRLLRPGLGRLRRDSGPNTGWAATATTTSATRRSTTARSGSRRAHTGAFAGTYELPIGKGRAVGADWSGVTQALLGGWNVSASSPSAAACPAPSSAGWGPGSSLQNSGFSFERPDLVAGVDPLADSGSWDNCLNAAAFQPAALGTFGNSGVGILRGPGLLERRLGPRQETSHLGSSNCLTFRVEAFNVLNHPNKGMPVRDITNTDQFGQILDTANAARVLEFAAEVRVLAGRLIGRS